MRQLAPEGDVYQAGTLSGNPVALTAGLTTLRILREEDGWRRLEALGEYLEQQVGAALADSPVPAMLCRLGSMFWIAWFTDTQPRSAAALDARSAEIYAQRVPLAARAGIALAPSAFEIDFLSLAHTRGDIDRLAESLHGALRPRFAR